jgi:hypothetical protein
MARVRDKLIERNWIAKSFELRNIIREIDNAEIIKDWSLGHLAIKFISTKKEINVHLTFFANNEISKKIFIHGKMTWNTETNKVADEFGIMVEDMALETNLRTESIFKNWKCNDVIRSKSDIEMKYLNGKSEFLKIEKDKLKNKVQFVFSYNGKMRNIRVASESLSGE